MNIGFINNFGNYPPSGGSSVHVYQLIKGFIKEGHRVCALQGEYPFESFKRYDRGNLNSFINDIDVLYLRLGGGLRQDVYSFLKRKRSGLPLIWEINAPADERRNIKTSLVEFSWRMMAPLADGAVCISREIDKYAHEKLKLKNTRVIPNGSDPEEFSPSRRNRALFPFAQDDDFVVLWAGSSQFSWHGFDIIHEVAHKIETIDKKVKFVLITNRKYLKRNFGVNVHIIDHVPYQSIPDYIASADLCLCLYQGYEWSTIGFYGSSLKLFDYMACARPVIASRLGQIREVIRNEENGILTDNGVEDIIQNILRLKSNGELARRMGEKAREDIVNHYNWDRAVKDTLAIFQELIK